MKRLTPLCALTSMSVLILISLSACNFFAPPAAQQTLAADHIARGTEIAQLRETATLQTDRLFATVEAAQTAVRSADQQSTRIASTLAAAGAPPIDTSRITPAAPLAGAETAGSPLSNTVGIPAVIVGQGGAQGNITILPTTPPTPVLEQNVAPQNDPTAAALIDLVISSGVGADDCALGAAADFTDTAEGVYLVTTARNLTPANIVTARFLREGIEAVFYDWSPSFDIAEACIWFYMPAAEVEFLSGAWSAALELDGQSVGTPLTFTVMASASAGDIPDNAGAPPGA